MSAGLPGPRCAAQLETVTSVPPPRGEEVADGVAHQRAGCQHVDAQGLVPDRVPLRILGLDAASEPHHRGVVDQDVDPSAPGERLLPEAVDLLGSAEVGAHEQHAIGRQVLRRRLRPGAVGAIVRDQVRAGPPERLGRGGADTLGGTRQQNRLPVEGARVRHHPPPDCRPVGFELTGLRSLTYRHPTAGDRGTTNMVIERWRLGALGLGLWLAAGAAAAQEKLVISNWDAYMPPDLLERFQAATGIEAEVAVHATNEEIMGKVTASGGKGFDVLFVSSPFAEALHQLGLTAPIDHAQVPNLKNLYPEAQQLAHDPGNSFSVPYTWGTTGLCWRSDLVPTAPTSWMDLLGPRTRSRARPRCSRPTAGCSAPASWPRASRSTPPTRPTSTPRATC